MSYINFNRVGITSSNIEAFYTALAGFAEKRGRAAASAWLFNLNPLANAHASGEMDFTGDGYTRRTASAIVRSEYDHAPLPVACDQEGCNGVAWYKATFGAHKCLECGELALTAEYRYLDDILTERKGN